MGVTTWELLCRIGSELALLRISWSSMESNRFHQLIGYLKVKHAVQ